MRSLFGDPNSFSPAGGAASYLVWCRHNSYSFFSFFLSFFQTHTHKRCIMKMISFSPFQTDRCGITQLLSCWTKRKSRSAQVVSRRWPKKKKKLSEDRTRFVIGRKRQCRSVFSLISSSFFSQQLYYGSVINLFALNGQMNNERPPPSLFSSYLVFFHEKSVTLSLLFCVVAARERFRLLSVTDDKRAKTARMIFYSFNESSFSFFVRLNCCSQ